MNARTNLWPVAAAIAALILGAIFAISTLLLLAAVAVGKIAARSGSRREGDIAMAIFASYVIDQFIPLFY